MARLTVDNPNGGETPGAAAEFPVLNAPAGLASSRVVLFGNNKPNVDLFLDELEHRLRDQHSVSETVRLGKLSAAFPAPVDVLDKVAEYQLAVNAVGD